jgi:hypothetical protein
MTDNAGSGAVAWRWRYADDFTWNYRAHGPEPVDDMQGLVAEPLYAIPDAAQARIRELEAQVRHLEEREIALVRHHGEAMSQIVKLEEAVIATHAAFENIPIGYPLKQNGQTIDHTLLNEAKRLCSNALTSSAPEESQ